MFLSLLYLFASGVSALSIQSQTTNGQATGNFYVTGSTFTVGGSTLAVSNGNVGIGTTPPIGPGSGNLIVAGSTFTVGGTTIAVSNGNVGIGATPPVGPGSNNLIVSGSTFTVGGSTLAVSNGSVGINVTPPVGPNTYGASGSSFDLVVADPQNTPEIRINQVGTNQGGITFYQSGTLKNRIQSQIGTDLEIRNDSSDPIRVKQGNTVMIQADGGGANVGIMNASPKYPLDVTGDMQGSGQIIAQGTSTVRGNAFSVGTSSLTVSNATTTVGGFLVVLSSFQAQAPSQFLGNVNLTGTNAMTIGGSSTFLSSITVISTGIALGNVTGATGAGNIAYDRTNNNIVIGDGSASTATITIDGWVTYTSSITGINDPATQTLMKFSQVGRSIAIMADFTGTGNATTTTWTVPKKSANALSWAACMCIDNGVSQNTPCRTDLPANSNIITVFKSYDSTGFTASGTRTIRCSFTYEANGN